MESTECYLGSVSIERIDLPAQPIKENDAQLFEKLKASIAKRGQLKTVLVCLNEKGRYDCLEGGKIVLAMKELGKTVVDAMVMPVTLSEQEKKQIRIELSRDYFLTNYVLIGQMLKELAEQEKLNELCKTIPFDTRQAENMIAMSDFDWEQFAQNKQIEGQISMFSDLLERDGGDEPDYSNVPIIEPNPDYVEPHIHKTSQEKTEVENWSAGSVQEQLREEQEAEIEDAKKTEESQYPETYVKENTIYNLDGTARQAPPKPKLTGAAPVKKVNVEQLRKEIEPPEPILKEVAPELFEEDKKTEPIEGATTQKEFEELLDSRPTAPSEPPTEPAPLPEILIDTDQPFYVDHRNVLVIKKYAEQIVPNLPSIAEAILVRKEFEKVGEIDRARLNIVTQEEDQLTVVTHVIYVSKFDVRYTLQLKDVYDFLTKIDFEE